MQRGTAAPKPTILHVQQGGGGEGDSVEGREGVGGE